MIQRSNIVKMVMDTVDSDAKPTRPRIRTPFPIRPKIPHRDEERHDAYVGKRENFVIRCNGMGTAGIWRS